MQEGHFSTIQSGLHQLAGKMGGQPPPSSRGMGADGAQLDVTGYAHALSRHSDKTAVCANTQIVTELKRPSAERPRIGYRRKADHGLDVIGSQDDMAYRAFAITRDLLRDHLQHRERVDLEPTLGQWFFKGAKEAGLDVVG